MASVEIDQQGRLKRLKNVAPDGEAGKRKLFITDLREIKKRGQKIVLAAPWDFNSTCIAEQAGADVIVIGGGTTSMMLGGQPTSLGATMEDVLALTRQVAPAVKRAVFYTSLPYGSFHVSNGQAVENAVKLVKAGAHCIKAQTPGNLLERAKAIIDAGIPFIGHVGLLPHLFYKRGGFKVFGRTAKEAIELWDECRRLQDIGADAIEMEGVPGKVAAEISKRLAIPIFGIGSGLDTDGQFIVLVDALGLQRSTSTKFAKRYVDLWSVCLDTIRVAVSEIRERRFPAEEHTFPIKEEEFNEFIACFKRRAD